MQEEEAAKGIGKAAPGASEAQASWEGGWGGGGWQRSEEWSLSDCMASSASHVSCPL